MKVTDRHFPSNIFFTMLKTELLRLTTVLTIIKKVAVIWSKYAYNEQDKSKTPKIVRYIIIFWKKQKRRSWRPVSGLPLAGKFMVVCFKFLLWNIEFVNKVEKYMVVLSAFSNFFLMLGTFFILVYFPHCRVTPLLDTSIPKLFKRIYLNNNSGDI